MEVAQKRPRDAKAERLQVAAVEVGRVEWRTRKRGTRTRGSQRET